MIVHLNGRFLPEARAAVSIHDRGFLYGDGLFESVRVYDGEPFLWNDHLARLLLGCEALGLKPPPGPALLQIVRETLRRNRLEDALVRITYTRGPGPRGYSPKGAGPPTLLIVPFPPPPLPATYRVVIPSIRLPSDDPLAGFKHLNKLPQIIARAEADAGGAHEALLVNTRGFLAEGSSTNLFWVQGGEVRTPPLRGILPGATRAHVLRRCAELGICVAERNLRPAQLFETDGVFVTSSAIGIMEVTHLDGRRLRRSPVTERLQRHYRPGGPA